MAIHEGYEGATACTDGPQPGALGAMSWFLATYQSLGGANFGIYDCRLVHGAPTLSLHGEGRAADFGIRPNSAEYGSQLAVELWLNSKELGIQCIIWNREIWSGARPYEGWREYRGANPHVDHLHVEFTWATAKKSKPSVIDLFKEHAGPRRRSASNMLIVRYGPSVYRLITGDRYVDITEELANNAHQAGIPMTEIGTADHEALTKALTPED